MLVRLVVEQALGETTARRNGDRRQLNRAGVIADRINARYAGVLEFIDDDIAFFVGFYAGHAQVEIIVRRFTANRPDQAIDGLAAAIFQLKRQATVRVFHHRFWHGVGVQGWAFGVHHFNQRIDNQRVKAAQRRVFTYEQVRFCAQAVNHAGQFHRNVSRANNGNAFWQGRQFEETVGVDAVFHARDVRVARTTTGGDQDVIGGDRLAVHFDRFRVHKAGETVDNVNVIFTQHVVVRGVNAVDVGGTAGDQFVPVEVVDGGVKAVVRAVHMDSFTDLRRMPHHFLRYTAHVHAGAAQRFGFNQRALLAVHGRTVDGGDAAAAAADCDVVIMLSHCFCP